MTPIIKFLPLKQRAVAAKFSALFILELIGVAAFIALFVLLYVVYA